jgi:CRISPR/Cas system-associated exonuclease Cas4 (RecB family)
VARRATEPRIIRASEVGRYAFCARAWWLGSVEGQPSTLQEEMAVGETAHRRHGQRVRASVTLRRTAYLLLALALLAAAIAVWQGV